MNTTTKALLYAAKLAYPQYEWFSGMDEIQNTIGAENAVCVPSNAHGDTKLSNPVRYGEPYYPDPGKQVNTFICFDPIKLDSDWVALREALDKLGICIFWTKPEEKYMCEEIAHTCNNFPDELNDLENTNPRELALKIYEILSDEQP